MLIFHNFPAEPGVGAGLPGPLDRLRYSDQQSPADPRNPIYTIPGSVTQTGYRRTAGYLRRSLPPLELGYSQPQIQPRRADARPDSLANLPEGIDGSRYQWVDLDGEGLSGVLTDNGGGWSYKRNLSPPNQVTLPDGSLATRARFDPLETVATLPSRSDLAGAAAARSLRRRPARPGRTRRPAPASSSATPNEGWEPFRPFRLAARPRLGRSQPPSSSTSPATAWPTS